MARRYRRRRRSAPPATAPPEADRLPRKRYLTATLPDGYVKTIGPTALPFTHYWRIVAVLGSGRTEVFWGHTKSLAEATRKRTALADAAATRGWTKWDFEVVKVIETTRPH